MDPDIGHWVLEYLLRSSIPDTLAKKFLEVLPFSDSDSQLKKTVLLRTIQDEVSKANVPEQLLEILEIFEELERIDGVAITEKMKSAYCAVAVECTVKYLEACPDNSGRDKYLDAVERIWRGRIRDMEESAEGSQLFTGELKQWRDDIEAALWKPEVCERLSNINSKQNALVMLKDFLAEAWAIMGPPFLEILAASMNPENSQGSGGGLGVDECDDMGDGECVMDTEPTDKYDGDSESSTNIRGDCVAGKRIELDNDSVGMQEAPLTEGTQDNIQLGDRAETLVDGREVLGGSRMPTPGERVIGKGNQLLRHKHTASRKHCRGVKITGDEEIAPAIPCSNYDPVPSPDVKRVRESLKSSSLELHALVKDPLPDALHASEIVRSKLAMKDNNHDPAVKNQRRDVDEPDPHACVSIVLYQPVDANVGKKSSDHLNDVLRPSLMERNCTARTYEWDDSIDGLPEGTSFNVSRFHLHSPRKGNVSPLEIYKPEKIIKRRGAKRWSLLEEDTLRAGVKQFGRGNWKTILSSYHEIFEGRTEVDLKDKWRNMTK